MPFGGFPLHHSLNLNHVARPAARGVRQAYGFGVGLAPSRAGFLGLGMANGPADRVSGPHGTFGEYRAIQSALLEPAACGCLLGHAPRHLWQPALSSGL